MEQMVDVFLRSENSENSDYLKTNYHLHNEQIQHDVTVTNFECHLTNRTDCDSEHVIYCPKLIRINNIYALHKHLNVRCSQG